MTSPLASLLASLFLLLAAAEGWLGVYLDPESKAPRILECVPGSPAEKAGLRVGDVVVGVDEQDVADGAGFTAAIRAHRAGDEIRLRLRRGNDDVVLSVVLGERPAQGGVPAEPSAKPESTPQREPAKRPSAPAPESRPGATGSGERPRLGLRVVEEGSSLRVAAVAEGSPAARAGFREGDVVRRAGAAEVTTHAELAAAVARGGSIAFAVERGGKTVELRVDLQTSEASAPSRTATGPKSPRRAPTRSAREATKPSGDATMPWLRDYDAAMVAAEKADLSVFVLYGDDDDGATQTQQAAFRSELVQDALPGYVAVYVDREGNPELHAAHGVRTLPVLEIRRGDRVLWRHEGYLPPAALRSALQGDAPSAVRTAPAPTKPATEESAKPAVPPGLRPQRASRDEKDLQREVEALRAEVRALQQELERLRRDARGGR